MQLYAGKRQRIGPHLYPFLSTDLTTTKTFSTFNDYRNFYRLLCLLKKNGITKTGGFKKLRDLSLLNEPRHEKSCFCIFEK